MLIFFSNTEHQCKRVLLKQSSNCLPFFLIQERKKDLNEHRDDSTFSFDPSSLSVRTLAKDSKKRIDARKGLLLASYSRKRTRRRKRGKSTILHANTVSGVSDRYDIFYRKERQDENDVHLMVIQLPVLHAIHPEAVSFCPCF